MIRTSALIVGLLVLSGCAFEPQIATFTMKKYSMRRECDKAGLVFTFGNGTGTILDCVQGHEKHPECVAFPPIDEEGCYMSLEPDIRTMKAERFRAMYDNQKAFRDSISSYSFQ